MSFARPLLCALPLLCSVDALAAPPPPAPTWFLARQARARRTTGIVLTSAGALLAATGAGLVITGAVVPKCPDNGMDCTGEPWQFGAAEWLGLTSLPFLGAGIPLWVTGNHRVHALSVGLYHAGDETRVVLAGRW